MFKAYKAQFYDVQAITRAAEKQVDQIAAGMKKDFEKTTATWDHNVVFGVTVYSDGRGYYAAVGTNDEIYGYVDKGTKPHTIRPRRAMRLRFRGGKYRSKTQPGKISSRSGGPSGGFVYAKKVKHPGTKARKFSTKIQRKWRGRASVGRIQGAITKALQRRK